MFKNDRESIIQNPKSVLEKSKFPFLLSFFAIVGFIIYSNSLHSPFVLDDYHAIIENPDIQINDLSFQSLGNIFKSFTQRPVASFSFAINYYFSEFDTTSYHVVNICIHILNAVLLFYLIINILQLIEKRFPAFKNQKLNHTAVAFFSALIWLAHPLHTQSVTYIVQRMNSMASLFYLLSLLLFIQGRQIAVNKPGNLLKFKSVLLFAGCIFSAILAFGSKQNALTLITTIFYFELCFFQEIDKNRLKRITVFSLAGFLLLLIIAIFFLGDSPIQKILSTYKDQNFSLYERLLTEPRVVIYYISLFLAPLPSRLMLEHVYPVSVSFVSPFTTLFAIVAILSLTFLSIYAFKKEQPSTIGIFWFLSNLVIESSIIGLALIFEHRTYLPSMLLCFIFVTCCFRIIKSNVAISILMSLIVILLSAWTFQRNIVWQNELTLYSDNVKKAVNHARTQNNLGHYLAENNYLAEAITHYEKAIELNPTYTEAFFNLGNAKRNQKKYDEALLSYKKAVLLSNNLENPYLQARIFNNYGSLLYEKKDFDGAIYYFTKTLQLQPDHVSALLNLGNSYIQNREPDKAGLFYQKALRIDPNNQYAKRAINVISMHNNE